MPAVLDALSTVTHVPNGPTNSTTTTTMFPLRRCGGKPLVAVTRERRYGPSRLHVNDDNTDIAASSLAVTITMPTHEEIARLSSAE